MRILPELDFCEIFSFIEDQEFENNLNEEIKRTPEKHLLLAVLLRSIIDLSKEPPRDSLNNPHNQQQYENYLQAKDWFESDLLVGSREGFSYVYICEQLNIPHRQLRAILADKAKLKALAKSIFYSRQKTYSHDQNTKPVKWINVVAEWEKDGKPKRREYCNANGLSLNGFNQAVLKYSSLQSL